MGVVVSIWRRSGVMGNGAPTMSPITPAQGPAALTMVWQAIRPFWVCTAVTRPPPVSMPVTAVSVNACTPNRRPAAI